MKKRIVSALLAGFLLVSATACGKQPAADAAQPAADPTQAYLDTVNVDYAYDLALKLEDIRSNETLGYRTAGSDAELATGDMLKAEMERIGLQNVTKDAFTLDTQDSLFGLSRRCIPSWVSRAHPSLPSRKIYHFIDSLKREPKGSRFSYDSVDPVTYRLLDFLQMCIASADLISSSRKSGCAMPIRASERSQVDMPFRFTMPYSVTI